MPTSIYLGNAKPVTTYGGAHAIVHRDGEAPIFGANITADQHDLIPVRTAEGERDRAVMAARPVTVERAAEVLEGMPPEAPVRVPAGPQITTIVREPNVADNATRDDIVANHVYATQAVWGQHSTEKPMWVASDDYDVATALAEEFGCPILPADLGALAAEQREHWDRISSTIQGPQALMVNGGRDATFDAIFSTAGYTYIGLTATSTAPSASDTSLTGQITTASGGLVAASATYAHTSGTSTATLTKTFTANGSDSLPVTIAQVGLRNASGTGGTFHSRTLLSSTATLTVSGDALTVTWTFTLTPS